MRVISPKALREFWERPGLADADQPFKAWYSVAKAADWITPADVKAAYRTASILASNRVCFNVAGNKYRLVAGINYPYRINFIRFVGTHAEYDAIDATTI